LNGVLYFDGGNHSDTFQNFQIMGMNQQIHFVNLSIQFGGCMVLAMMIFPTIGYVKTKKPFTTKGTKNYH